MQDWCDGLASSFYECLALLAAMEQESMCCGAGKTVSVLVDPCTGQISPIPPRPATPLDP
jgi:hypothetical protein